jgi:methionyl-tRNA synthetase
MSTPQENVPDIETIKSQAYRPRRAVITAGMPYANKPLHLGHLAGVHVPADIYARWMRMLIGAKNVLFVCGSDDHGSISEIGALEAGKSIREFIDGMHKEQRATLDRYAISLDTYSGTSRPDCFPIQKALADTFIHKLYKNGMLEKRASLQWFDPKSNRFLQDRFVRGKCPNPKCDNENAYSDECDSCGSRYEPSELINPRSAISDGIPVLRETLHWWLDMWKVSEVLRVWIEGKKGKWRTPVFSEVINTVLPSLRFDKVHEDKYKELKATLPQHKGKYALGKKIMLQFENKTDLNRGHADLQKNGIPSELVDGWAHRSITRDVAWGIPLPTDLDPDMAGKTLYVWPDSLIAPISFSRVALIQNGIDPAQSEEFWTDPEARIFQFLGQDNVYFYVLMQGALWLGTQDDPMRLPQAGDFQFTDIFGSCHLMVGGDKMSTSLGNFVTGDQLLDEKGYSPDQIRYYLALMSLPEKPANFDFDGLEERNRFLAGPINSAFERPISACHSKFGGTVPEGVLSDKIVTETTRMVQRYLRSMERAEYATLLNVIENYARVINSLFTQFKPHDDRYPEPGRRDALYSSFYVLKTLMIMLYPFVPQAMERLRESLRLEPGVFRVEELGRPIPAGHVIGPKQEYFPAVAE